MDTPDIILGTCFSTDGLRLVATDSCGMIHAFGFGMPELTAVIKEQFFALDWIPVREDQYGGLVDEQSQLPAHLVHHGPILSLSGDVNTNDNLDFDCLDVSETTVLMFEDEEETRIFLELERNQLALQKQTIPMYQILCYLFIYEIGLSHWIKNNCTNVGAINL